jgi:hypothetical protein
MGINTPTASTFLHVDSHSMLRLCVRGSSDSAEN